MSRFVAVVFVVLACYGVSAINVEHMRSLSAQRAWQRQLMMDIDCAHTKMGYEKEMTFCLASKCDRAKKGDKIWASKAKDIPTKCHFFYNTVFGTWSWDGVEILEFKADDHCKGEIANIAAVNHASKHGPVKKDHLAAAAFAGVKFVSCTDTVETCVALGGAKFKGKAFTFAWKVAAGDDPGADGAPKLSTTGLANVKAYKIHQPKGVQFSLGVPLWVYGPKWHESTNAQLATLKPWATKKGVTFDGGSVCKAGTKLSTDAMNYCLYWETMHYQFTEVQKKQKAAGEYVQSKDTRSILPKLKQDANCKKWNGEIIADPGIGLDKFKALGGFSVSGNQIDSFQCGETVGMVVEVRNGVQPTLDNWKKLFKKGGDVTEQEATATATLAFKQQEDIWTEVRKQETAAKPKAPPSPKPKDEPEPKDPDVIKQQDDEDGTDCKTCCVPTNAVDKTSADKGKCKLTEGSKAEMCAKFSTCGNCPYEFIPKFGFGQCKNPESE